MEYQSFLDYAFPAFGVCALIALLTYGMMHVNIDKYNVNIPSKLEDVAMWALIILFGVSTLGMVLIGFFLPWGSPF